jgi:hypothetical protein
LTLINRPWDPKNLLFLNGLFQLLWYPILIISAEVMGFFKTVAGYGLLPLLISQLLLPTAAYPSPSSLTNEDENVVQKRADAGDFYLRVMPLGASITAGDPEVPGDKEKNGYRKNLRDQLRFMGWEVNMVGNFNRGSMADNVSISEFPKTVALKETSNTPYFRLPTVSV